jgi:signal transduction histidine kinase
MMREASRDESVAMLAQRLHTDRSAILAAWKKRTGHLPAFEGETPIAQGARVLEWLTKALEVEDRLGETASDLPREQSFSSPRAIAELALLAETIAHLEPALMEGAARGALHGAIDSAVVRSLAREYDENDRVRKRLRLATDVTLVGCWELDPETGSVEADARCRELFEIEEGDPATVGTLTAHLHPDDQTRVREGIASALTLGQPYSDECRTAGTGSEGSRWIAIAADAHEGSVARVPSVLGIVHDITAGKRAEERHARVVEELSRAVHISEMFVGILSHDLRNPLGAIMGGAQLLGLDAKDEKAARVLKIIVSSGERMGRMIDQLLDFTRARLGEGIPLERTEVDLAKLAREVVAEGEAGSAGAHLRLAAHGEAGGEWDRDRVCQILSNLLGNAVQHGAGGGSIDVVVDGSSPDEVIFSVENQGVIPPDILPVIFNPFRGTVRKRGKSKGLGLGLYVARQIALAHGGDLAVSASATGTVFTLTLPRRTPSAPPPREELVREEELAAFEGMAAQPTVSAITAQLFGATPLHERVPLEHAHIVEGYGGLLEIALQRKAFRVDGDRLAEDLRALAERLGDLGAGPREITDIHARALRQAVRGATAVKTQALLAEGRLLALEMMGNLASYYRRRSRGHVGPPVSGRPPK